VHKTKLNKCDTTIHTNWNGTLDHTPSATSLPKYDSLDDTLNVLECCVAVWKDSVTEHRSYTVKAIGKLYCMPDEHW